MQSFRIINDSFPYQMYAERIAASPVRQPIFLIKKSRENKALRTSFTKDKSSSDGAYRQTECRYRMYIY